MNLKNAIEELKRRNVFKAIIAYLAFAWILLQVFSVLLPIVDSPKWVLQTITIILFIGFPCWLLFSWNYQITSEGLKKTENVNSEYSKNAKLIYGLFIIIIVTPLVLIVSKTNTKTELDSPVTNKTIEDSLSGQQELTTNLIALDYFKRGEFYHKRQSLADIDLAIENYLKAIENDSLFAMAYNNLGSAYMRKNLSFDPSTKWEEEAYAAAEKALQIDPNLANPHIIQGQFFWSPSHNFAHREAINQFNKAISKDSTISQAYEQLSLVQLHIGLFDKAFVNAQKSISLDPSNYRTRRFIAEIFLFQGKYQEALNEFNKIPKSFAPQPTQAFKALTYFYLNQSEKAIELLKENLTNYPNSSHINSVYAIILSNEGNKNEALNKVAIAQKNIDEYIHAHHIYYYLGVAYSLIGENKECLKWLEKAANSGFPNYPLFSTDPNLKSLKDSDDFIELLNRLKGDWDDYKTI